MVMVIPYSLLRTLFGKKEIEAMVKKRQGQKLKQTEKNYLSRSVRPKLRAISALAQTNLLQDIAVAKRTSETQVSFHLAAYGYPLLTFKKKIFKKMPLEDLIIEILTCYPRARYIEAIPFLLLKNHFDAWRLLELAVEKQCKNKVGYLVETAYMLGKRDRETKELLQYLKETKIKKEEFLVYGDRDFLQKTSPARVKQWHLLGRFFDRDFQKMLELYR